MPQVHAINPLLQAWLLEGPLSAEVPAYIERLRRGWYATANSKWGTGGARNQAQGDKLPRGEPIDAGIALLLADRVSAETEFRFTKGAVQAGFLVFRRLLPTQPLRYTVNHKLSILCLAAIGGPLNVMAQVSGSDDTRKSMQAQAERAGVIVDRGAKPHYSKLFDLSGLPHYQPTERLNGWLRIHGNNYLVDGNLGQYWAQAFAKAQPGIRISWYLPTAAIAFAGLYYDQADIVMGHKPSFYDLLAYQRIKGFNPVEIAAVTGSYDVPGWESATVILVNQDNPIQCISFKQLDGVFGAARDGGWAGTNFRPDWARGADKNIRTWGELGVKGGWANKPIQTYGFNLRYNTSTDFADRVMQGGDKWNDNLHGFAHIVKPDGKRYIQGDQITDALAKDKYGMGYNRFRGDRANVKRIAVSEDGKPCVPHTLETVQARTYPLYNEQYFYTSVKPGAKMDAMTKEFLKFILSQEGQTEVMRDGKYLPLTAEVVGEQLKKLDQVTTEIKPEN